MKINIAVIYRLKDLRKSILSFYLIVFASYLLISFLTSLDSVNVTQMSGLEMATMIFLFITGLNSFKPTFLLFVQNGVSRKTMFYSFIISMVAISSLMALIDSVVYSLIGTKQGFSSMFDQLYVGLYEDQLFVKILVTFIWALSAYLAFCIIGYFITILYYRMHKTIKLIVSISVPCILFIGIPIADVNFNGKITLMFKDTFNFFFGTGADPNPLVSVVSCCCISVIFGLLSYGIVKRVVIKRT